MLWYSPVVVVDLDRLPLSRDGPVAEAEGEGEGLCQGRSWDWVCWVPDFPSTLRCGSCTFAVGTKEFLLQEALKAEGRKLISFLSSSLLRVDETCRGFVALMGLAGAIRQARRGPSRWRHKETGPLSWVS